MKFAKSILIGTGSLVLAGLILVLLAPRAAHAVAATAVQVMNTSAAPVITQDAYTQASQIVNLECDPSPIVGSSPHCYRLFDTTQTAFAVPLGQHFVMTSATFTPSESLGVSIWTALSVYNPNSAPEDIFLRVSNSMTSQYTFSPGIVFSSPPASASPVQLAVQYDFFINGQTPGFNGYISGYITAN